MRTLARRPHLKTACSFLLATMLVSTGSWAAGIAPEQASADQKADAMKHFTVGKHALEEHNWERAILELRESLAVVDSPNARLELARGLRDWGRTAEAYEEYGTVARDARKLATGEPRYEKTAEAASNERAALESKLALLTVNLPHEPEGATLKIAGRVIPQDQWSSPIAVAPGAVDIVLADASGKQLAWKTVSAMSGKTTAVSLEPEAPPPQPVAEEDAPASVPPSPSSTSGSSGLRTAGLVAGGIGIVGFGLFGVFGAMDNATFHDLQGACPNNKCPASKQSELDSGRTQQTVANVGLVVGALGVATGVTLLVLSLSSHDSAGPATGLVVGPGFMSLRGTL